MTEPTITYNEETGDVYVTRLPESQDDLGKEVECIKIGQLEPHLSDDEFRAQMSEIIDDLKTETGE
jgi:hypothetical protein